MKKFFALVAVAVLVAFAAPALAANPFMDVPMNHWAYDAIGQLASHGIITGYPDGTYKGNQPMTRYELATLVARALAVVDMDKASKQDVEMLKKLVVEFKDELDALGVKVDEIDSRVAVLEENIGGWKLWGELRFDVKYDNNGNYTGGWGTAIPDQTDFNLNRYRLWMSKQIDDNTKFVARLGAQDTTDANGNRFTGVRWERYYIETLLGYDIKMMAGRWNFDWEDEYGLYVDDDAWFTDRDFDGFYFTKDWGMADVVFFAGKGTESDANTAAAENTEFGLRANFNVNEQFRFALSGLYQMADEEVANINFDQKVYWVDFAFNFNPNIAFKGIYYLQDNDINAANIDDSPNAYRAIVDVKQEAFGFTSLWLEYAKLDRDFNIWTTADPYTLYGGRPLANRANDETTILFARLDQRWNDKWSTFQRYVKADFDRAGVDDATNWTFGVRYQYTPAIMFELAYDDADWGQGGATRTGDDNLIRFRTHVKF